MGLLADYKAHESNAASSEEEMQQITDVFARAAENLYSKPDEVMNIGLNACQDYMQLWQSSADKFLSANQQDNQQSPPPKKGDKRFKNKTWQDSAFFDFVKESYLINAKWLNEIADKADDGLEPHIAKKLGFYTRQFIDALSPSNFVMTNPEVMEEMVKTNGQSLINGLNNMYEDIKRGGGKLQISMTDENAFEFGKNIAATKGSVVFQNDLMQLIQYEPQTKTVHKTPLLLVPAWINKYYVLDMREENSFINWLVGQGHSVFVISWVNPTEKHRDKAFEDYMIEGVVTALDTIETTTGESQTSTIGYCLGGTLLACTLAYLQAKGEANRVASATYLTTMIDFFDAGELSVFIDDKQISLLEEKMQEKGYLEGYEMANSFNMLRANDLIWSFFVNNYLLGKSPFPFDLLYWNSDSTRMPAKAHGFYMRNMYLNNKLIEKGGINLGGVDIDLRKITTPTYILSCRDDHIAPWKSTFAATKIYQGDTKFVLASSGHIAGVINPPAKNKYCYWESEKLQNDSDEWLENAAKQDGSWWLNWDKWQSKFAGEETAARSPEDGKLEIIEPAPASYASDRS